MMLYLSLLFDMTGRIY